MKKSYLNITLISATILVALISISCNSKKAKINKSSEQYASALQDSLRNAQRSLDSCTNRIKILNDKINHQISNFSIVENPREVEGYYILNGWQKRYPPTSTGIIARISKNEQLELIAHLRGASFDQIIVFSAGKSINSDRVPYDQALNYRLDGNTTVMFSGLKSDSIAQFIADNELNNIEICFTNNGRQTGRTQLGTDYKKMILDTHKLSHNRKELTKTENLSRLFQQKINILRAHTEK